MAGMDWNGNDRYDMGDRYMDYEIMNEKKNGGGGSGGNGGTGCGSLCMLVIVLVVQFFIW